MKNIIKIIGLISFIFFGFFYTDKVLEVIREEDSIMIDINSVKDSLKVDSVDARIIDDAIIPGINGKVVNINKSYQRMKSNGSFILDDIVYDDVYPNISIVNNKDKYIVQGNPSKNIVSFVVLFNNL